MVSTSPPNYLVIGHICADLQPDGSTRLGGSALFAASTAHRLGCRAAILTACADDLDLSSLPAGIEIVRQPAPSSTIFENRYTPQGRVQYLHGQAPPINLAAMPTVWQRTPIIHLAPIIQEVPHDALARNNSLVGVTPQGWLRVVHPDRVVTSIPESLLDLPLRPSHLVVLSEEDVQGDEDLVRRLAQRIDRVVLTRAERGATVWEHRVPTDVPAFPANTVDPTGAGDVFTAALLISLQQGQSLLAAARWACATAAFAVEGPGITTLPTVDQVRQRAAQNI